MEAELEKRLERIERLALLGAKDVLTVQDAALLLGRSEKTIRNNIDKLPHYYGPMGIVFKKGELENYCCKVKHVPVTL